MATPGTHDLTLYQGDTKELTLTFLKQDQTPVDFTGYTGRAQIRRSDRNTEIMATFVVSFPDPAAGKLRLTLTAVEASKLLASGGVWDLETTDAAGRVRTWVKGAVAVDTEVTR